MTSQVENGGGPGVSNRGREGQRRVAWDQGYGASWGQPQGMDWTPFADRWKLFPPQI